MNNEILLQELFPKITLFNIKKYQKYKIKFNLTPTSLKCLNQSCNNNREWNNSTTGFKLFCSKECQEKNKLLLKQYQKEKREQTNLKKFGTKYPIQRQDIKDKLIINNLKKYGVENISQLDNIKKKKKESYMLQDTIKINKKKKETYFQKTGYEHPNQKHLTNYENWNNRQFWIDNFLTKDNYFDYIKCKKYFNCQITRTYQKANELNIIYTKFKSTSLKEQSIIPILNSLGIQNIITNNKDIINPFELDIYLPDHNLAIEYNGIFWHQESKRDKFYHQSKSIACYNQGIRLLHIFEDYNDIDLKETITNFLTYIVVEQQEYDLTTGCYPIIKEYQILEPELIFISGFNIWNAGKIKIN